MEDMANNNIHHIPHPHILHIPLIHMAMVMGVIAEMVAADITIHIIHRIRTNTAIMDMVEIIKVITKLTIQ